MIGTIDFHIDELNEMKTYPQELSFIGNLELLKKRKVAIVGSRKPNQYTRQYTHIISSELSKNNICIVSGAAMGVDAIAHTGATSSNTIAVAGTGLAIRYPVVNNKLIEDIEQNGLILSQFKNNQNSTKYTFVLRNELVVALSEILIVTQADINSGTMRSVEFALKMGKPIYVLPHRINDSEGTNKLLKKGLATCIYDVDTFISNFVGYKENIKHADLFLEYCKSNPTYDEAMSKYPSETFEYELNGKIIIKDGRVTI